MINRSASKARPRMGFSEWSFACACSFERRRRKIESNAAILLVCGNNGMGVVVTFRAASKIKDFHRLVARGEFCVYGACARPQQVSHSGRLGARRPSRK